MTLDTLATTIRPTAAGWLVTIEAEDGEGQRMSITVRMLRSDAPIEQIAQQAVRLARAHLGAMLC